MVKELRADSHATVVAVHCRELTTGGGMVPVHPNEAELESKIEQQVRELGQEAQLRTAPSMVGGAAHVIAQIAEEEDADLIIAGTRGRTSLEGLLVGSVTQRLLHLASCPVLVVPAGPQQYLDKHTKAPVAG
jgi:nucleotide-binding universal stress UspA family protein